MHNIQLKDKYIGYLKSREVNYSAFLQKSFRFAPTSFTAAIEGLKPKVFSRNKQIEYLEKFLEQPLRPINFAITSAPNDGKAKLLAAWMMQHIVMTYGASRSLPLWHDVTGSYQNPLLKEHSECSLLVLNNIGEGNTLVKREKTRDLMEAYANVPKVLVVSGVDPFEYMTRVMYLPMHGCAYLTNDLVQRKVQVI